MYQKYKLTEREIKMKKAISLLMVILMLSASFTVFADGDFITEEGFDARNYGGIDGIVELRRLFAELFEVDVGKVLVGDNSSLNIMYNLVQQGMQFGFGGGLPWNKAGKVKFICLVPGYDRHFAICENFGIDMISVPFKDDGDVDMDVIEGLVASDSSIKGIWCVPKYSNPTGAVYSDDTVGRFARMSTAADDFRIFWDNAYAVHGIYGDTPLKNIISECEAAGNPDRTFMFSSTSKITYSGAGVAVFISSEKNVDEYKSHLKLATVGPNKLVQLAHYRYLKNPENVRAIMQAHAELHAVRPPSVGIAALSPEAGDLHRVFPRQHRYRAVPQPRFDHPAVGKQGLHLLRQRRNGNIPIVRRHAAPDIPHTAAHRVGLKARPVQPPQQCQHRRRDLFPHTCRPLPFFLLYQISPPFKSRGAHLFSLVL